MDNHSDIKLKCNFCRDAEPSDELYLVHVKQKDYLLCIDHMNDQYRGNYENNSKKS